ncbi:hypothetical protein BO86DRAFT_452372 [Aspergillus japonicus CBS 114.51]|uniref:Uncharacterized protein n=1 Tax=Aspergillus japonicus CBS 114.51 TaxID=1448312 RepID=A0A8T8XHR9_ASPJA|nr:hypothetical protein BO86DRAFT_452372 [Aspergillus japonicus CBS 114.51]RAH87590.1 hypothetical protein BO86DRAFT_452372 [Aspergillus japonicus CBS 114.51]
MRYLSKRTHEIETFSKKKVSDIIISDRKSEDFRVRDGKQAVANNSMEVRFRAGLGVSSLAEDFLKYSDEICQHSKLDEMLLNSKKGSSYQQYTEICPHFTDKRGAALLIGIGIKFKFLERILKTKLQELSVNTELSDSLPLSYVWITFFAWSYIPRCSPNALQVIAQNLISGEVWKNLAASARSWRDECSETYRSLCFSCSPAYGFARSSSSSGSSAIDGAIFSQCSQPSLEAPDTDGAAASTSPSSSSEILGPENVVEKPVSVPTLVNPLPPSSLSETSNSADVVSSPNPPLTTKRRLSSGAIPIPSKHQRTMDHEPDDDVYTNATVPELHSISDSDPFGPDMEHTVLASIAQGVSIPTVTLSPYNPNPDIDIWNCPIFSETLLSDESSRVPSSPAILDVDIWNIPVFSEGFEPGDDVIPDNPLISSINPPGENVDSWDDPMAHTSTQDRNDNHSKPVLPVQRSIFGMTRHSLPVREMVITMLTALGSSQKARQVQALTFGSIR